MSIRLPGRTFVLASTGVALLATAAVAGSGVGGVFNLGQTNTVDVRTLLQGNTNVQLHVVNQSTAVGSVGVFGTAGGVGVLGQSVGRVGVRASATGTTGTNYGLYGETASRDGFAGFFRNTGSAADPKRGHAIRVLGAGATGSEFPSVNYAGGGEFAGPNGVVGYPTFVDGAGVAGFTGAKGNTGVYGVSTRSDGGYAGLFQFLGSNTNRTGIRALAAFATGDEKQLALAGREASSSGPMV